ncbi:MAG: response regulator [Bdellovibrionales bacterium]
MSAVLPCVLVVDDSLIARFTLVRQLRELGYVDVIEADDGEQALKKLHEARAGNRPFGLIITDLTMPNMSGIKFLRTINEDPEFSKIPKLITSVETDRGTVLNAIITGADGYILKPSSTPVLKEKLDKISKRPKGA